MKRPYFIPSSVTGAALWRTWPLLALRVALVFLVSPLRAQDPAIYEEPSDQYSTPGRGATFTARATATNPAWYEWHFTDGTNDRAFPGTFNIRQGSTLTLTNLQPTDFGGYYLVVTNELGSATSRVAQLIHLVDSFERIEMGSTDPSWGVAWADYNNDDHPDLFICSGALSALSGASLYRNNQDGTFTVATPEEAGEIAARMANWGCAAWGDYDNDGNLDLIGCDYNVTQSTLWRNLGNGRFTDATAASSFRADFLGGAPLWGDFNGDGYLDLVVANAWSDSGTCDLLYLNRGDGTFRRVTDGDLPANGGNVEGGAAGDMDGDGDLDILLAHSTGVALFENDGAAGFHRVTAGFPVVTGYCITSSWADYDNDGRLDVFVAVYDQTSQLIHNDGNGQWTMIPLGEPLQTSSGMWADYDNDGDLDLFITRGQSTITSNLLYANNGDGTFTQVTVSTLVNDQGRWAGCAWADYDNNGFLDLFVTGHYGSPDLLYRNTGNDNHWILLKLVGTRSNRSAIGAKVRVQATLGGKPVWQMREIGGGNRHQNDLRPHFGLGDATVAQRVIIEWPSGAVQELSDVAVNQFLTVWEPPALSAAMGGGGVCELTIEAEPNRAWQIKGSSDLMTWQTLATVTPSTSTFQHTDDTPGMTCRFYRVE